MTDEEHLLYEKDGHVARITLNRPAKLNAMTDAMHRRIADLVDDAGNDEEVKVVVLRGNGRCFSAGYDLSDPALYRGREQDQDLLGGEVTPPRTGISALRGRMEDYKRIIYSAKPTIAQVHGYALADGLIYAVMCDYVIASDDAVFGNPEGRWGPVFSPFLAFTVPHTGLRWAVEVASTGRRFDASEAQRVGLINRVVPRADLDAEVDELARALSTITRDTMATGRAFLHWYHEMLGLSSALRMHVGITAADVNKTVADDEFDFGAAIEQNGLKAAIAERNRLYGGAYWGY